jgi:hypothetical protein
MTRTIGSEVAVFREHGGRPSDVVEIATVRYAGEVYIELTDGRRYAAIGGLGLNTAGSIVPARPEHRAALARKRQVAVA